jgi:predicted DNA-binding transcriptional regulator AlpA
MKPTNQLEFDFRIPCHDPIKPLEAAKALGCDVELVYQAIYSGKLAAIKITSDCAAVAAYRIPLKNFISYLNAQYADQLYFRFPTDDLLTAVRVARALHCSDQHIYNHIRDGEFPNAINLASKDSIRSDWRIPLCDLVAYVNRRREGNF